MDKRAAKELDYVLSFFKRNKEVSVRIINLKEQENKTLTYDAKFYLDELVRLGLIEQINPNIYKLVFNGFIFGGFENEENLLQSERNKARNNEWLVSRGAMFAAIFSGCLIVIELIKFWRDSHSCCLCN